jgi:hypothetical protein
MATRRQQDETVPLTLGQAAAGRVRLIVWCKRCSHQIEPDPAELASRHGEAPAVIEMGAALLLEMRRARGRFRRDRGAVVVREFYPTNLACSRSIAIRSSSAAGNRWP